MLVCQVVGLDNGAGRRATGAPPDFLINMHLFFGMITKGNEKRGLSFSQSGPAHLNFLVATPLGLALAAIR